MNPEKGKSQAIVGHCPELQKQMQLNGQPKIHKILEKDPLTAFEVGKIFALNGVWALDRCKMQSNQLQSRQHLSFPWW